MMNANAKAPITIFTQRLAGYLMMNGFPLLGMRENKNGNNMNVFFFGDTPEIREEMRDYIERNQRRKRANCYER